jgi:hypothetical protein
MISIEGSRGLARARECVTRVRKSRLRWSVNLLMFQPVNHLKVLCSIDFVEFDALSGDQLLQPARNEVSRIVVVWVEKAREHSRGCASPPRIIDEGPQLDEQKARVA